MTILITGVAGFVGFHMAKRCMEANMHVIGIDNMSDYYDINLKKARLNELNQLNIKTGNQFTFLNLDIENKEGLHQLFETESIEMICNFAGQAGVRYSLENPQAYISTNIQGFFNLLECAVKYNIKRFIYASSSSVYGANTEIPYKESDKTEQPVSVYAATKKANELLAYSYSSIYKLPTIGLRFFTVYGPWGRPDMSPYLFTTAITKGLPLKVFNKGEMLRDFTYIDDIIEAVFRMVTYPQKSNYEIYNIGHSEPVVVNDFIRILEEKIGKKALRNDLPMQKGDMLATYADATKLAADYNFKPQVSLTEGLTNYLTWFNDFYPQ